MRFRKALALAGTLGLVMVAALAAPAQASGGGGCGEPITDGQGTEISIESFCFTPTVLYGEPGDTIAWTNRDGTRHNVGGANLAWGSFETLRVDRSVSYSFSEQGVYSYVCSLHPGMMGTVVIGDPDPGSAAVADEDLPVRTAGAKQSGDVSAPDKLGGGAPWTVAAALLALVASLLVGVRVGRRTHP
jgi:plastocyanin